VEVADFVLYCMHTYRCPSTIHSAIFGCTTLPGAVDPYLKGASGWGVLLKFPPDGMTKCTEIAFREEYENAAVVEVTSMVIEEEEPCSMSVKQMNLRHVLTIVHC
jgi:hypothetical protein